MIYYCYGVLLLTINASLRFNEYFFFFTIYDYYDGEKSLIIIINI